MSYELAKKAIVNEIKSGRFKRAVIQKDGRLAKMSWNILKACFQEFGITLPERDEKERRLIYPIKELSDAEIIMARNTDIPRFVENSLNTLGIVGDDQVMEQQPNLLVLERLGTARSSLQSMVKDTSAIQKIGQLENKSIATSYPRLTNWFLRLARIKPQKVEQLKSVEAAVASGDYDAGFDLVETGETMRANKLRSLGSVQDFEAVVVCSQDPDDPVGGLEH